MMTLQKAVDEELEDPYSGCISASSSLLDEIQINQSLWIPNSGIFISKTVITIIFNFQTLHSCLSES